MAVKHTFAVALADDADPSNVDASHWNADHTIENDTITLAMLANIATARILGRSTAGAGDPEALTGTQATALLDTFLSGAKGLVPASGGGTSNFLRADGNFAVPPGATDGDKGDITVSGSGATWTIDVAVVSLAKMANLANQRLIGRNTAGTGVPEAVTASQLFDWVSSTNGVLLTRTGGSWAALASVTTDAGNLVLAPTPTAAAPAAGTKLHGIEHAGRSMLAVIGPEGVRHTLGAWQAQKTIARYQVIGGGVLEAVGMRMDVSGTATARAPNTTSLFLGGRRVGYVSAAGAGSVSGVRAAAAWLTRYMGFHFVARFGVGDAALVATANMFVGVQTGTGALTDVAPSTLANLLGFGCDNGDTTLQLYAAGVAAQARTNLGANFPVNSVDTDVYEAHLYCPPNGADVKYLVTRLNTGHQTSGTISAAAALPAIGTTLTNKLSRANGGTAAAVSLEIFGVQIESEL